MFGVKPNHTVCICPTTCCVHEARSPCSHVCTHMLCTCCQHSTTQCAMTATLRIFCRWASILYSFCTGVKQTCRWQGDALESSWTMPSSSPRSPIFAALIRSTFYFAFHASVGRVSSCVCARHDRNRANSPKNAQMLIVLDGGIGLNGRDGARKHTTRYYMKLLLFSACTLSLLGA